MEEVRFRSALDAVLAGSRLPVMHYQPIVDLRRATIVGYEALARFPGPPNLPPDRWFLGAQARGKRNLLESLVMRLAVSGRELLPPDMFLSVNLSPVFLLSRECDALLVEFGDLSRIVLEITEGDRIHDYSAFRTRLDNIRNRGGSVAIDDTGSGYASLKHVMELRPQFVKLDRFFVEGCHAEPAKGALIHMIGETADRMDAWLVAEGIETELELHELMRHGVPLGQGYYLGRPSAEMLPLTEETRKAILARSLPAQGQGLWPHIESAQLFCTRQEAERSVDQANHNATAVVVDTDQRPVLVIERHPLLGTRALPEMMRVQVASGVAEVLRRAMARPLAMRFDPVVVIGERGQFHGMLRIDYLAQAALGS
jgi:EAL domain-containing protein (putative c-di-GMP-specific phosphodiesterase class I)